MNVLACRACRRSLLGKDGCAVCSHIRRNLVVLGESEEDRPSLSSISADAVRSLREQVRHYEKALKGATSVDDQERWREMQRRVSGSLSKLLDAARKIQADGFDAVKNLSFAERAKLFVEWFMSLPQVYRDRIREEIAKYEVQAQEVLQ